MTKKQLFFMVFLLSTIGCREPKIIEADLVGVWKSEDGASITINEDGTCILDGLNASIVGIAKGANEKLTTKGTWKLIDNVDSGITGGVKKGLEFTCKLADREGKGGIEFYISGQGISENQPPWDLFIWNGDPDEMRKYKFVKQ